MATPPVINAGIAESPPFRQFSEVEFARFGRCLNWVTETAPRPLDFEEIKTRLEKSFGLRVVLGRHAYEQAPRAFRAPDRARTHFSLDKRGDIC